MHWVLLIHVLLLVKGVCKGLGVVWFHLLVGKVDILHLGTVKDHTVGIPVGRRGFILGVTGLLVHLLIDLLFLSMSIHF